MQAMIRTDALSFSYPVEEGQRRTTALDNVTLSIEKGSFVVVLGHNGSGKSTLAKHMNAVLLPSGGAVYVEAVSYTHLTSSTQGCFRSRLPTGTSPWSRSARRDAPSGC